MGQPLLAVRLAQASTPPGSGEFTYAHRECLHAHVAAADCGGRLSPSARCTPYRQLAPPLLRYTLRVSLREFFFENFAGDLEYHPRRAALYLVLAVAAAAFWFFSPAETKFTATPQQTKEQGITDKDEPKDAEGQYQLGLKYARGTGVTRDDALAARLFRRAAEQGNAEAQAALGFAYHLGRGVPQSDTEALKWLRKAAEQGQSGAQYNLGFAYFTGGGVPQNDTEAVTWFRKAAEQGFAPAQNNLGAMYTRGRGVAQDFAQAVEWYRKAAEQGQPDAQTSLGELCANGDGTPKDDAEAIKWFRKAAEQGDPTAQIDLGRMYEAGRGISRDTVKAYVWFSLSAAAGNDEARSRLSDLAKRMTSAQIAEGKGRADAWLAQHQRR